MSLPILQIPSSTKAGPAAPARGGGDLGGGGASPGAARPGAAGPPPSTFNGAVLPICGVEVLIVVVRPWVLADIHEANLFVVAFHERFRRTIVLMAQTADGAPYFYGPTEIVRLLRGLPFEMIPWRRLLFRTVPPPSWQLPIPPPRGDAGSSETIDTGAGTEPAARADPTRAARPAARAVRPADLRVTVR